MDFSFFLMYTFMYTFTTSKCDRTLAYGARTGMVSHAHDSFKGRSVIVLVKNGWSEAPMLKSITASYEINILITIISKCLRDNEKFTGILRHSNRFFTGFVIKILQSLASMSTPGSDPIKRAEQRP